MDVILYQFHTILPLLFHKLNDRSNENDDPRSRTRNGGKGMRKGGANGNKEEQRNSKNKLAKRITNDNQAKEFKIAKGKTLEGFQGKYPQSRVKWMRTFMCPCYHMKGECCDEGCKYSMTHIPASEVPQKVKKEYLDCMRCCRNKSSASE
jgi:hypothetical protein